MSADTERLLPPNEPATFESLCLDLCKEIWNDPGAQKNGRSGQPQAGVDVFGQKAGKWFGVQCKQKNGLLRTKVLAKELKTEVEAAKQFTPHLTSFILATSGPADAQVQLLARKLTQKHQGGGLFTVEVWSWEKIWHELYGRRELLKRIQPVYWPTIGLKNDAEKIPLDKWFVKTAVVILAAYALIMGACYFLVGKEITAIIGGGLTVVCVGIHKNFPKLRFERIPDSQKKVIPVPIQKFSWYSLFSSLCVFLGAQVVCAISFGVLVVVWKLLTSDIFSTDPSLGQIFREILTSRNQMKFAIGLTCLSYLIAGFFVGKTSRNSPYTYAIVGSFLYALLSIGVGVVCTDDLMGFAGLGRTPVLQMRQDIAEMGVYCFLFIWLSWVGARMAIWQSPYGPHKKQRS